MILILIIQLIRLLGTSYRVQFVPSVYRIYSPYSTTAATTVRSAVRRLREMAEI